MYIEYSTLLIKKNPNMSGRFYREKKSNLKKVL